MLNEEALKLFNTIMAILDERDELIEMNKELEKDIIPKAKIREKIGEVTAYGFDNVVEVLQELLEEGE